MAQWYVKELSQLTGVSVQTLHHYDRIGLLKPSVRLPNGYRLYSEKDLLKLQQIVALKFFGFELSKIKALLSSEVDILKHFNAQAELLEEKAKALMSANQTLKTILAKCSPKKILPWKTIIELIEVYRMTQQLEKTWAGKIFTKDELQDYAQFAQHVKTSLSDDKRNAIKNGWREIVREVEANLDKDPTSDFGIALAKRCLDWVKSFYGKKYAVLANAIWEKGFKKGQIDEGEVMSVKGAAWLDAAFFAYHRSRVMQFFSQQGNLPQKELVQQWETLLSDILAGDPEGKEEVYKVILKDEAMPQDGKDWLKKYIQEEGKR